MQMLKKMGFDDIEDVRVGKSIELTFDKDSNEEKAKEKIKEISEKVLSNPVIEDFEYEFTRWSLESRP